MIRIGFCDDEEREIKAVNRYVQEYISKSEHTITYKSFSKPMELLDYTEKYGGFDILLVDIYMPVMLGTDVGKEIRCRGENTEIIFMTTSRVHAIDAYAIGARQYLTKPYTKEHFFEVLDSAINDVYTRNESVVIKTTEGVFKLNVKDILYSCTHKHYQQIYMTNGTVREVRLKSSELGEVLTADLGFFRCNGSQIINLRHIVSIQPTDIILDCNVSVPISRGQYKATSARYMEYVFGDK